MFNRPATSQCKVKLHKRPLCEVLSEFIATRRPERIVNKRHIPAIKERRYQVGCIRFIHAPSQMEQSSCLGVSELAAFRDNTKEQFLDKRSQSGRQRTWDFCCCGPPLLVLATRTRLFSDERFRKREFGLRCLTAILELPAKPLFDIEPNSARSLCSSKDDQDSQELQ